MIVLKGSKAMFGLPEASPFVTKKDIHLKMAGLAYRKRFRGSNVLFYIVIASLIVPSIVVSLGIGLEFRLLDDAIKATAEALHWTFVGENYTTAMDIYTSGLGAQLTWTLPFGLLITFAIFNRFDRRFEEAAHCRVGAPGAADGSHRCAERQPQWKQCRRAAKS